MNDIDFILNQNLIVNDNTVVGDSILMGPTTQWVLSNVTIESSTVIDASDITLIQSASYVIQISSESGYGITEVILVHNNRNSYLTEYGRLNTTQFPLATFSTEIVNNEMRLIGTALEGSARIWFHKMEVSSVEPTPTIDVILTRDNSILISRDGSLILARV